MAYLAAKSNPFSLNLQAEDPLEQYNLLSSKNNKQLRTSDFGSFDSHPATPPDSNDIQNVLKSLQNAAKLRNQNILIRQERSGIYSGQTDIENHDKRNRVAKLNSYSL